MTSYLYQHVCFRVTSYLYQHVCFRERCVTAGWGWILPIDMAEPGEDNNSDTLKELEMVLHPFRACNEHWGGTVSRKYNLCAISDSGTYATPLLIYYD